MKSEPHPAGPAIDMLRLVKRWKKAHATQKQVLAAYDELAQAHGEEYYFGFKRLCERTGLEYRTVRRVTRCLFRRGLTEFSSGLFTYDGELAGSGYRISKRGQALLSITNEDEDV